MINDHERNILKMQDQIEELSQLLLNDWQALELHAVEEEIFRVLLRIGNNALAAFVEKKAREEMHMVTRFIAIRIKTGTTFPSLEAYR